jgi:ribosome-associated protein
MGCGIFPRILASGLATASSDHDVPCSAFPALPDHTLDGTYPQAGARNPPHPWTTMQTIEFELEGDYVELNMLLKLTGLCDSGGAGKAIVSTGAVSVDGQLELRKTCKIRAGQRVRIDEVEIHVLPDAR